MDKEKIKAKSQLKAGENNSQIWEIQKRDDDSFFISQLADELRYYLKCSNGKIKLHKHQPGKTLKNNLGWYYENGYIYCKKNN